MNFLYSFSIFLMRFAIGLASIFNQKARKWVKGRKHVFGFLKDNLLEDQKYIWIHAASLGEFEQGRPIIEGLKKRHPNHKILLSFFSPSGYEIRKNYEYADLIVYLPVDSSLNARRFLKIVKPEVAVFVKYEFWFNYLKELKKQGIPIVFVSAIFREDQHFFKSYGAWFRKQLSKIDHFFVQNNESRDLLKSININQVTVSGDTRFDRVYQLAQNPDKFDLVEEFKAKNKLVIAGSTWPLDEEILFPLIAKFPELKFVIASHEVHESRLRQIQERIEVKSILFSQATPENVENFQVLIVDSIGVLAHLYQYATMAYIGGGFGKAIHNIQEPVTFGIPVIFGPNFKGFQEAVDLIKLGSAFTVKSKDQLEAVFQNLIGNDEAYQKACETSKKYVNKSVGATKIILDYLQNFLKE